MTLLDRWFLGLMIVDGLCLIGMAVAAMRMLETLKRAQARTQPAIREVKALADTGKALVAHAKQDGQATVTRVTTLVERVKARVNHTRNLIQELKPHTRETVDTVRNAAVDVADKAQKINDVAQRLSRLKTAAQAAAQAARTPEYHAPE
jgi:methyl-accepting chemotaxis protein